MNKVKELSSLLNDLGVELRGKKVHKESFQKAFGGTYRETSWIPLRDYPLQVPPNYLPTIEEELENANRVYFDTSTLITRFGEYLNHFNQEVAVDGLVFQYALKSNPRNVQHGYIVFVDGKERCSGHQLGSSHEAERKAGADAKRIIEEELVDVV